MIGVSTSGEMTKDGSHRRSVVVAFLGGDDIEARAEFVGNFSEAELQVEIGRSDE